MICSYIPIQYPMLQMQLSYKTETQNISVFSFTILWMTDFLTDETEDVHQQFFSGYVFRATCS